MGQVPAGSIVPDDGSSRRVYVSASEQASRQYINYCAAAAAAAARPLSGRGEREAPRRTTPAGRAHARIEPRNAARRSAETAAAACVNLISNKKMKNTCATTYGRAPATNNI